MSRSNYMDYEFDLAGSRSKNRFRFEVYWGLSKFMEVIRQTNDFTMVFDYVCDVEIHYADSFEFYQVKTAKGNNYSISKLVNKGKKSNSVIGTLYKIRTTDLQQSSTISKLALVSNLPLGDSSAPDSANTEFPFTNTLKTNLDKIVKSLQDEFPNSELNLDNIVFIRTDLSVENYRETMIGKVNTYYHDVYGVDAFKPAALLNVLSEEVQAKADFEEALSSHEEILEKKGLSTLRFEVILEKYSEQTFSEGERCKEEIRKVEKRLKLRRAYALALPGLLAEVRKNFFLANLIDKIKKEALDRIEEFEDGELLNYARAFLSGSSVVFPVEYDKVQREILVLIALIRLEEESE